MITNPGASISTADIFHYELLLSSMGTTSVLDDHIREFKYHPDVERGVMVGILVHVLNRLIHTTIRKRSSSE